ncbi:MAG: hypothetical protein VYC34_10405 [Planctomycetota bacterium]|nr:hypothetical protein [Planctomycetota bacterium]
MIRLLSALSLSMLLLSLCACGPTDANGSTSGSAAEDHEGHEHPELAAAMTQMQHYTQKLGYSIQGKNQPLAAFYLHEVEELGAMITEEIPTYEGHEIAKLMGIMFTPQIEPLEREVNASNWEGAERAYAALINNCNSCHASSAHGFIQVTVPSGPAPFNQVFEAAGSGAGQ